MKEEIQYEYEEGSRKDHDVTVLTLSTCAFCKRAMDYLNEKDIAYRHVHLDEIYPPKRREFKKELQKKFGKVNLFPFTIVDDSKVLKGFKKEEWDTVFEEEAG